LAQAEAALWGLNGAFLGLVERSAIQ